MTSSLTYSMCPDPGSSFNRTSDPPPPPHVRIVRGIKKYKGQEIQDTMLRDTSSRHHVTHVERQDPVVASATPPANFLLFTRQCRRELSVLLSLWSVMVKKIVNFYVNVHTINVKYRNAVILGLYDFDYGNNCLQILKHFPFKINVARGFEQIKTSKVSLIWLYVLHVFWIRFSLFSC